MKWITESNLNEVKRISKIAVGLAVNSMVSTVSWLVCGNFIDKDLTTVYSLTYPLQFIIWILTSIASGCFTYAVKDVDEDKTDDLMYSTMYISFIVHVVILVVITIMSDSYITYMGFDSSKLLLYFRYSVYTLCMSGIIWVFNGYYNFKRNESFASKIIIIFNLISYGTFVVGLLLFDNTKLVIAVASVVQGLYVLYISLKTIKKIAVNLEIVKGIKYSYGGTATNICLFICYFVGIGGVANDNYEAVFAFSIWTAIYDWVWDVICGVINTIIVLDVVDGVYSYKKEFKKFMIMLLTILSIVVVEMIVTIVVFNPNMDFMLPYIITDVSTSVMYIMYAIRINYLNTTGYEKKTVVLTLIEYIVRVGSTFILHDNIAVYGAQMISITVKLIATVYIYRRCTECDNKLKIKESVM